MNNPAKTPDSCLNGFSYTFEDSLSYSSSDSDSEAKYLFNNEDDSCTDAIEGPVNIASNHIRIWKKGTLWIHTLSLDQ